MVAFKNFFISYVQKKSQFIVDLAWVVDKSQHACGIQLSWGFSAKKLE